MAQNKLEELHYHAAFGRYFKVQSLLNGEIDPDGKNSAGQTPVMLAAQGSHKQVVELFITSGADIKCCDDEGWTVLHHAAYKGSVEIVRCLVKAGVSLNDKNSDGLTPLTLAVEGERSHREVFELLINSGADIQCCNYRGSTPLHYASKAGSFEIVQSLVNKRADLNKKNSVGLTPLMLAAKGSHRKVFELLINSGADIQCCKYRGSTPLHYASKAGSLEIVQSLVNKRADLNEKNFDGLTPLMLAAKGSHREVVELLINSGAVVHCSDDNGWTLLHHASNVGWVKIVQSLVNEGVSFDVKNSIGQTPLMMASHASHREIVELLIELGADFHSCDNCSWTVLHHAVYGGSVEIVQHLVNEGVALNMKNCDGNTPLHLALLCDAIEIANCLLKAGADCHLKGNDGESPFDLLIKKEMHVDTIKLCIVKGACVKFADDNKLLEDHLTKNIILQDIECCSQTDINKFNSSYLPLLYKDSASVQKLSHNDKINIENTSDMALEVENPVTKSNQNVKGFWNLYVKDPLRFGMICVKSSVEPNGYVSIRHVMC